MLALLLAACPKPAPTPIVAPDPLDQPIPADPGVTVGHLDNGLTYYIEPNKLPEHRATLHLAVHAGSLQEEDDQLGLAHVVEHMAFNGSTHFAHNELVHYLESVGMRFGADVNAHTSFDETVYDLVVPTDDAEAFEKAFLVLEDWAHGLTFDPDEVGRERGVVMEEWRRRRGASGRVQDQLIPLIFAGSKYAVRLPIGTEESLKTFTPDQVVRFYKDWYRPDLMAVIAVGDFDPADVEAKIKAHFTPIANPSPERPRVPVHLPPNPTERVEVIADPEMTRTSVSLLWERTDPQDVSLRAYRQDVLESLLLSVLNERLDDLAHAANPPFLGAGVGSQRWNDLDSAWAFSANTRDDGVLAGYEALRTEIERLRRYGVTEAELARARAEAMTQIEELYQERDTTQSRDHAAEKVRVFIQGETMPGIENEYAYYQKFVPDVGLAELGAFCKTWGDGTSSVLSVVMPQKDGVAVPTEADLHAVEAKVAAAEIAAPVGDAVDAPLVAVAPAPGKVTAEAQIPELGITTWTLSNGVKVWVKPTDFKADDIQISAFSPGGTSKASDADFVAAQTAANVRDASGLGEFPARALEKRLAGANVHVNAWVGPWFEGIQANSAVADLETALQLVYLSFTAPRFEDGGMQLVKDSMTARLQNRSSDPGSVFNDRFQTLLWNDALRYRPWTVDTLAGLDLQKSAAFYEDRFADAGDFGFVIVGNVDPATLKPLVEQWLGALPAAGRTESWVDDKARLATGVHQEKIAKGIEAKARVHRVYSGAFVSTWDNRNHLQAMGDVLQVMLRERLREAMGGTYHVSVNSWSGEIPVGQYQLGVDFECDPARVDELKKAADEVIATLRDKGPPADIVEREKAENARSHEVSLKENDWWTGAIAGTLERGEDPKDLLGYEARNDAVTPAVVQAAAKTWIDPKRMVEATLVPAPAPAAGSPAPTASPSH